jgi:hypothetical protein
MTCLSTPGKNFTEDDANQARSVNQEVDEYCNPPETIPSPSPTIPDPTKPSDDPTKPSDDPTKPSDDPTKPSDDPTKPCSQYDDLYDRVMFACNTSNPATCSGLCSDLSLMDEAVWCIKGHYECASCHSVAPPDTFGEFQGYVADAGWYCQTPGGEGCTGMMSDSLRLCSGGSKCKDICEVSRRKIVR